MDFCGLGNAWGPLKKEWLTRCFDDLVVFGVTYVFIFIFGSYRVWSLRKIPIKPDFPYSTRHSVKVMILGWLGTLPLLIFAIKYANKAHDDFEWIAKPLASLAWFFSLWIMNLEAARDMRECWILRTFWILSAVAGVIALPTVILHAEAHGYSFGFYVYLIQFLLYIAIATCAVRFLHQGGRVVPGELSHLSAQDPPKDTPISLLSPLYWSYTWRLFALFAPEKFVIALGLLCSALSAPLSSLAFVIVGRLFNNFYYPYSWISAQSHLRDYCLALIVIFTVTCFLDSLFTIALFVSGERMGARTRRRVFHAVLRQEAAFFDKCKPDVIMAVMTRDILAVTRGMTEQCGHGISCVITIVVSVTIQLFISWKLTLVVLSIGPVCVLAIVLQRHFSSELRDTKRERIERSNQAVAEGLDHFRVVRSYGGEEAEEDRYSHAVKKVYDLAFRHGMLDSSSRSMVSLMFQLSVTLGLYIGGILVLRHSIEVGYLVTLFALQIVMVSCIAQLPDIVANFQQALAASESIFLLLDRVPRMNVKGGQNPELIDGHFVFSGVKFSKETAEDIDPATLMSTPLSVLAPRLGLVSQDGGKKMVIGKSATGGVVANYDSDDEEAGGENGEDDEDNNTTTIASTVGGSDRGGRRISNSCNNNRKPKTSKKSSSTSGSRSLTSRGVRQQVVFNGLELEAKPGNPVLIVGGRGSGKSSLAQLIQRMYDIDHGLISLDGRDIRDLDPIWLRDHICVVQQDPTIFCMTIANNIGYGQDGMSQTTVERAARASGAHDWIQALPDGYQAVVGEKGVRLSPSQRAQIGIARALAVEPHVLVLDDCLSVMEPELQRFVVEAIRRQMARRTLIVLSSRPDVDVGATSFYYLKGRAAIPVSSQSELLEMFGPPDGSSEVGGASFGMGGGAGGGAGGGSDEFAEKMRILKDVEQCILSQPLERDKALDLLDLVTEIKEALSLNSRAGPILS